jgi:hypothetical protein
MVGMKLTKTCNKCNTEYPATTEYFYRNRDLLATYCKSCITKNSQEHYKKNKKDHYTKGWKRRIEKVGFTSELYFSMFEEQNGVCALCGTVSKNIKLSADHDHKTGKARGLLCHSCNIAVGYLEKYDDSWLNKAQKYIKNGGFFSGNSQENVTQLLQ